MSDPRNHFELFGLRLLAGMLDPALFGVVGRAMHAADWLTTSRFCGRCGSETARSPTERCSICPRCKLQTYPRISPAIITLVRKGDLALLANNAKFPGAFYSTLAGSADALEWWQGGLVLAGYAVVFLVIGASTFWRRDVT